ncbi:MAG: DNA repair protein RecO [Acidobacteriota bacterium]
MPLHTTEAFTLRTYSLAEADKICVFLTKDHGKVRGVAHGARKIRSRFGSSLEPFTEVSLTYFQKEGRELVSVSNCEILRSHFVSASRDVETASAFSYMAEILTEFLPDNEPNEKLYRLVAAVLEAIEQRHDLALLLRYFETWALRLAGYFPDTFHCSSCGEKIAPDDSAFLTAEGAPRCRACSEGRGTEVSPTMRRMINKVFRAHPTDFARERINPDHLARLGEINYQIIRHALERDLRSRALLRWGMDGR